MRSQIPIKLCTAGGSSHGALSAPLARGKPLEKAAVSHCFGKQKPAEHTAGLCALPRFAALVLHIGHQVGKGVYRRLLVRAFGPQQGLLALG